MTSRASDSVEKLTGTRPSNTVTVVGGTGAAGNGTTGAAATSFALTDPGQMATDANGNLFVTDKGNHRVVRFNIGTGGNGNADVIATGFNQPVGLARASNGDLYVADGIGGTETGSRSVWKVSYNAGNNSYGTPVAIWTGEGTKPTTSPYNDFFYKLTLSPDGQSLFVVNLNGSYGAAPKNLVRINLSNNTRTTVLTGAQMQTALSLGSATMGQEVFFDGDGVLHVDASGCLATVDITVAASPIITKVGGNAGCNTSGSVPSYFAGTSNLSSARPQASAWAVAPSGCVYWVSNYPAGLMYVVPTDTTAPSLTSATVNAAGTQLTLTYNEALKTANPPVTSNFSVASGSTAVSITSLTVTGQTVVLNLGSVIEGGRTVTVSYSDPTGSDDANATQDVAGNGAASLTNSSVTNNSTQDLTAPTLTSATVNAAGTQIALTYGEALDSSNLPLLGAFAVSVDGASAAISSRSVANSVVTVVLSVPVRQSQVVTITYTDPSGSDDATAIQDAAGNDAGSLSNYSVTNSSTLTTTTTTTTTTPNSNTGVGVSAGPAPTLVTSSNQAALEAEPGEAVALINGRPVQVEVVSVPAAATPTEELRVAQNIVATINSLLPTGATNSIRAISTPTGAELTGMMVNPDDPREKLNIPIEAVKLIKAGENAAVLLTGLNQTNLPATSDAKGALEVTRGGIVAARAYGLPGAETGEIVLMSTPRLLKTFTVSANGTYVGQVPLPTNISFGSHTVVMATKNAKVSLGIKLVRTRMQFRVNKVISTRLFKNRAKVKADGGKVTVSARGRCKANSKRIVMAKKPGGCYITVRQAAKGSYKSVYYRFTVSVVRKLPKKTTVTARK